MTQAQSPTASAAGNDGESGDSLEDPTGAAGAPQAGGAADADAQALPGAGADITYVALLAEDLAGSQGDYAGSLFAVPQDYDGHVALALDPGILPNIDTALDLLTSSPHLFDIPVVDFPAGADDVAPA